MRASEADVSQFPLTDLATSINAVNVESFSESYFKCLGQLRHCSEKITDLVNSVTNASVIHYESAFTEVKDTCEEIIPLPSAKRRPRAEGPKARVLILTGV